MKIPKTIPTGLAVALACAGCDSLNQPLNGSDMLMAPVMESGVPTTSASGLWGSRGLLGYRIGFATQAQIESAEAKGRKLLAQESVRRKAAKQKVDYVSVSVAPTPSQKAKQKWVAPAIIKVNIESGKADKSVYSPDKNAPLRSGNQVGLGGDPTLYLATSGTKI